MQRDDALLLHVLLATRKIIRITKNADYETFLADDVLQDSVIRQISIIGEAVSRISSAFRDAHPEIPWKDIVGMRHKVVHDYMKIDLFRVWQVASDNVPRLEKQIEPLVPPED